MHFFVKRAVVGFLVDGQAVDPGVDHLAVARGFHRIDFDGDGAEQWPDVLDAGRQKIVVHRLGRLPGNQQDVAESQIVQHLGFAPEFIERQGAARNLIAGGKSAITATVGAEIGDVNRRVKKNVLAETAQGQPVGPSRHLFQIIGRRRRQQSLQIVGAHSFRGQGPLHVGGGFRFDALAHLLWIVLVENVEKCHFV